MQLIGDTRTETGLVVRAELDEELYPAGVKVTNQQLKGINLHRAAFHGEGNYTIKPSGQTP